MLGKQDMVIQDPLKSFEVNIFNKIVDAATTSLKTRFNFENNALYADLAYFDPKAFSNINLQGCRTVEEDQNDELDNANICEIKGKTCKNCLVWCYRLLSRYNMLTGTYSAIGSAFKLRSNLTQDHLESFMLMPVGKEILENLDLEDIIDEVAFKSKLLKSILII
ncbi:hypothetical protein TKK_0001881 [Trichogramma kaykai]